MIYSGDDDIWMCEREFCAEQTGCDSCPVPLHNKEIADKKKEKRETWEDLATRTK